ncbi:MAG: hypothetical protein GX829_08510 [Clostridium sp.]|nr:hypothetical protein [Clostridium sp.]
MRHKPLIKLTFILIIMLAFTGCSKIEELKIEYGYKNTDFEFLKNEDLKTIIIQSTRDKGFRFVVRDQSTIYELYESLSTAKVMDEVISYNSDYIFEFHNLDGEVFYYEYVAGVSEEEKANFYSEGNSYLVTDRIDNNLIQNLYSIRKPKYFEDIYYDSLVDLVKMIKEEYVDMSIGIKVYEDLPVLKYQLSKDLEEFKNKLKNEGAVLLEEGETADLVLDVKTSGFTTITYKAVINLVESANYGEKKYYILGTYANDVTKWETIIGPEVPDEF